MPLRVQFSQVLSCQKKLNVGKNNETSKLFRRTFELATCALNESASHFRYGDLCVELTLDYVSALHKKALASVSFND